MIYKKFTVLQRIKDESRFHKAGIPKTPRYSDTLRWLIIIFTVLCCSYFFSFHFYEGFDTVSTHNLNAGYKWRDQSVIAKYSFPVYKKDEIYHKEIVEAVGKSCSVFIYDSTANQIVLQKLDSIINELHDYIIEYNALEKKGEKTNQVNSSLGKNISETSINNLLAKPPQQRIKSLERIQSVITGFINNTHRFGFINISRKSIITQEVFARVFPNNEIIYNVASLTDSGTYIDNSLKQFRLGLESNLLPLTLEISDLIMVPNLIYSQRLTEKARELSKQEVAQTDGYIREGETIISTNELLTEQKIRVLQSYDRSKYLRSENVYTIWYIIGGILHSIILISIILLYLFFIRKRIFFDNVQIAILCSLLILTGILSWLTNAIPTLLPIEYLVFIPSFSMLVAIVFDSRTAFYTTVTMALLLAGIRGTDYDTGVVLLTAGMLAAYSVRDIQSRTQMFQSVLYIFGGFTISLFAIGLERSSDIMSILNKLYLALINSAISPILTYAMLFVLERITNITTDLRLQEFNNLNHPLLVKLNEIAPGTYQHTQSVVLLAERCASAINANPLLTRVGGYFHDIGKITKPEYFTENQINFESKHDLITPRKSAEAIKNHVSEGIRIAKEYHLPQRIIDFIPMHHGTTLIKHFYAKALEEAGDKQISESDFRYPGPKPSTKEAAIVMICDSVEAVSRVVGTSDINELEKAIEKIINDKFLDGQFDECNISLKDLRTIEVTCIKYLIASGHQRIQYKEIPVGKINV